MPWKYFFPLASTESPFSLFEALEPFRSLARKDGRFDSEICGGLDGSIGRDFPRAPAVHPHSTYRGTAAPCGRSNTEAAAHLACPAAHLADSAG